jgi:hypothetical protein
MDKVRQNGQILLITLLVLSVALTIALSLIGRTTTDSSISTQVEESSRAFNAAEAGIEKALKLGTAPVSFALPQSQTRVNVSQDVIGQTNTYITDEITKGKAATIWLIHHQNGQPNFADPSPFSTASPFAICWNSSTGAAIEVTVYYISGGVYRSAKIGFDSINRPPTAVIGDVNKFNLAANSNCSGLGDRRANISFEGAAVVGSPQVGLNIPAGSTMIFMRIRPVYANAILYIDTTGGAGILPDLGNTFISCGSSLPGITRCISAKQLYPDPPEYFDYVLYADSGDIN